MFCQSIICWFPPPDNIRVHIIKFMFCYLLRNPCQDTFDASLGNAIRKVCKQETRRGSACLWTVLQSSAKRERFNNAFKAEWEWMSVACFSVTNSRTQWFWVCRDITLMFRYFTPAYWFNSLDNIASCRDIKPQISLLAALERQL